MTLKEQIEIALHEAMRQNNDLEKNTLRMLLSSIKMVEIDKHFALEDNEVVNSIQKEIKMRNETLLELASTDRSDLVQKARQEIDILNKFLPSQLTDEELIDLVKGSIKDTGAKSIKDMGMVMKIILPKVNGRASSERISNAVKNTLTSL